MLQGVALIPTQFAELMAYQEQITKILAMGVHSGDDQNLFDKHLGYGIYAKIGPDSKHLDIRKYWLPKGASQAAPTKRGICINEAEWTRILSKVSTIKDQYPKFRDANRLDCYVNGGFGNQLHRCEFCDPFNERFELTQAWLAPHDIIDLTADYCKIPKFV